MQKYSYTDNEKKLKTVITWAVAKTDSLRYIKTGFFNLRIDRD